MKKMKLAILLTSRMRLLSVAAILDVFESVNRFYKSSGQDAFFDISLFYLPQDGVNAPVFEGYVPLLPDEEVKQDIVFIPAFGAENIPMAVQGNVGLISFIKQQYNKGAEVASFCTGAFLLAATGLLNGKKATTHIDAIMALASAYSEVSVQGEQILTHEAGIYTSGGATSSFHLMIHLIEKHCGREMAVRIAKLFAIDMDRHQQSCYGVFQMKQHHSDELVSEAQKKIENNYRNAKTIEEIIRDIPASRRNIVRRFKQATGVTPISYLQQRRIEAAKQMLEQTDRSILEVMLDSGYNDLKAFRQLFKKNAGMTPKAYRDKFRLAVHA